MDFGPVLERIGYDGPLEATTAVLTQSEKRRLRALLKKLGLFAAAAEAKTTVSDPP